MSDGRLSREARAASAALGFLTRAPIPFLSTNASWREDLARAPRYFPLIGGAVGACTGALYWALCFILPPFVAAALALTFEALATGAFHEDALADFCDAFGGGNDSERVQAILKDSRIGSYGTLGLCLGVVVRWAALASLAPALAILIAAAAGALGRLCAVATMRLVPPAPDRPSLAKDIGARPSWTALFIALMLTLLIAAPAAYAAPLAACLSALSAGAASLFVGRMMLRKLGGSVGDGLGAIAFGVQTLTLVAFTVRA